MARPPAPISLLALVGRGRRAGVVDGSALGPRTAGFADFLATRDDPRDVEAAHFRDLLLLGSECDERVSFLLPGARPRYGRLSDRPDRGRRADAPRRSLERTDSPLNPHQDPGPSDRRLRTRTDLRRSAHAGAATREGDTLTSAGPSQADTQIGATRFYLWSTIGIPSILYILTTNVYFYHYFYVLCPFLFVLVAACMLPWRRVLLGLVIAQAVMSATYLTYLHQNGGTRRGEYGPSYARQGNR